MPAVLKAELEAITPVFVGGALPAGHGRLDPPPPRWRGPSLRGALRFWFRALSLDPLAPWTPGDPTAEQRAFGGHGKGTGQGILMRTASVEPAAPLAGAIQGRPQVADKAQPWVLPYESIPVSQFDVGRGRSTRNGLRYLAFPFGLGAANPRRLAIAPGSVVTVYFVDVRSNEAERMAVVASLWLLTALGGIGMRSRRGFGSLSLRHWEAAHPGFGALLAALPPAGDAATHAELAARLRDAFDTLRRWFPGRSSDGARFPHLRGMEADAARTHLGVPTPAQDWPRALNTAGTALQSFRDHLEPDYSDMRRRLVQGAPLLRAPSRAAFGLPLTFRSSASRDTTMLVPYGQTKDERSDRHASPLLLHLARTGEGLVPVWTLLSGPRPGTTPRSVERSTPGRQLDCPALDGVVRQFLEEKVSRAPLFFGGGR